jgi:mxaJ protein
MSKAARRRTQLARLTTLFAFALISGVVAAQDRGTWELRVCADPEAYPISSSDLTGYENRVAAILADELGAELTYEWTQVTEATVRSLLKRGACDAVMSAGEGAMDLLNTVAYQRINNVFLYLADRDISVGNLYDPALAQYRIGALPNSSVHSVLFSLGLDANFVGIQPNASKRGAGRIEPYIEALREGRVDVVIVSGGLVGPYVQGPDAEFAMSVVEPELVPPLTPTFHLATIGVRARDEGLRDALNIALARRWEEVQQVLADMGVPMLYSPPILAGEPPEGVLKVGVIAPYPTGFAARLDEVGDSAFFGARLAEDLVPRGEGRGGLILQVVHANAPSAAAAERALQRLVHWDGVAGVVLVHDDEVAGKVLEAAGAEGVPVLNAFASSDNLRSPACYPTAYHVAPSDAMYLNALSEVASDAGARHVRVVHDGGARALEQLGVVRSALSGSALMTDVEVGDTLAFTMRHLAAVLSDEPDVILLLLRPDAQLLMIQELDREGFEGAVLGFPWPEMQTREFYYRIVQDAPDTLATPRVAGWEATVAEAGADELNLRFASRSARVMDVTAWSTFASVETLVESALLAGSSGGVVLDVLKDAVLTANLHRPGLAFDATNQLQQPLYLVSLDPAARWSEAVSERTRIASLVGAIAPADGWSLPEALPCGR